MSGENSDLSWRHRRRGMAKSLHTEVWRYTVRHSALVWPSGCKNAGGERSAEPDTIDEALLSHPTSHFD
ncbi:hypothetical protein J6590_094370 [Homalodisca vitripennis]|nr:hypothetical protein J6590_094370 [Homalodisca vitripennis]